MERRTRGVGAQHEQRRQEIADAALAIVAEQGLQAVSLPAVAKRASVSVGRVQHYFPSKEQLIAAAFDRGNTLSGERIRARVGQDLESAAPLPVLREVLTELIPYDQTTRTHLRVRQSFTALALSDEAIAMRLREEYDRLHRTLARLIERGRAVAERTSGPGDPYAAAVQLVAAAEGLAYYVLIDVTPADTARDLVLKQLAEVCGEFEPTPSGGR